MLLALDIGNTSVSFGVFDISENNILEPVVSSRVAIRKNAGADEYAVIIKNILDLHSSGDLKITCAAISSVVPSATGAVSEAAGIISGADPYIIGPGIKTGFKISIYDPACLGADIVSNAAAAIQLCSPPIVIFDAGTAGTITVIDDSGALAGTVITPGIRISASALCDHAELLDPVSLCGGELPLIGRSTDESVRSGLIYGNAMMLDGFLRNIRESYIPKDSNKKLGLIATGEFGKIISDKCRNKFLYDVSLTIKGVAALYMKNCRK